MTQELAVEQGGSAGEQSVAEYDSSARNESSHLVEKFGMGVAAGILVSAVVGVLLAWVLGVDSGLAMMIALGLGFILSPVIGLLIVERGD